MNVRRVVLTAISVAAGTALVASCSSSGSNSNSGSTTSSGSTDSSLQAALGGPANYKAMQALYNKAVKAGQTSVVIYGPSAGSDQTVYSAFKKSFPKITMKGVPVVGPPMDAKLSAEHSSGKHIGDIAYTGGTNMMQYLQKGYFASFTPSTAPGKAKLADGAIGPDKGFWGVTASLAGIVSNTNKVKNPPTKWTDLVKPEYKGKLAMYDPTAIGQQADVFAHLALNPKYKDLMAGLKANNVQLFPATSITGPLTAVAQGAKDVAVEMSYGFYQEAKKKGAPVRFSLLDSDNYTVILYQAILKGAPHPDAAKLYMDWMFTPQAQKAIAEEGAYSTVKGADAPQGLKPLDTVALQKTIPLQNLISADNAAIQRAKQYWGG